MMVTYSHESKESKTLQRLLKRVLPAGCLLYSFHPTDSDLTLLFLLADSFSEASLTMAPEAWTPPPAGMGSSPRERKG